MNFTVFSWVRRSVAVFALVFSNCFAAEPPTAETVPTARLFAVEIHVGENWDGDKAPQEQAYFAEHSANIRKLTEAGNLRLGARYSDKGLLVLLAASEQQARALLDQDPSFAAGTFQYQLYPFSPFHWSKQPRPD